MILKPTQRVMSLWAKSPAAYWANKPNTVAHTLMLNQQRTAIFPILGKDCESKAQQLSITKCSFIKMTLKKR